MFEGSSYAGMVDGKPVATGAETALAIYDVLEPPLPALPGDCEMRSWPALAEEAGQLGAAGAVAKTGGVKNHIKSG